VKTLRGEALAFQDSHAYVLRTEKKQRSPKEIAYNCFAIERQAPPDHWPLLAGEAIHNLRSALDHTVHAASGAASGTQFPIFTDARDFRKKGRKMISRTPPAVRALIEKAQPYNRLPAHPTLDALARLNKLSNLDKHRVLNTVACAVHFPYVGHSVQGVSIRFTDYGNDRPLHEGTKVMSFVAPVLEPGEMEVEPNFAYEVRIEGMPLEGALVAIAKRVFEAVTECETGQPISPVAAYPIY
jgi:hypothetical protein